MVSDSYQAQRIANKLIQLSDQQKIISFPANLSALRITAGDRVQVTVEELSWNQKVFECVGWTFSDEGGVNLTLREDSSLPATATHYLLLIHRSAQMELIVDAFEAFQALAV
jgi:hypothetical protein